MHTSIQSIPTCQSYRASARVLRLAAGLVLGLGACPVLAADTECAAGSKAPPAELIAACTAAIEQAASSPKDQSAALVGRADAHARTSGGLTLALKDLDRAVALDGRNARAYRLRGDLMREAGGDQAKAAADLSMAISLNPDDAEAFELRGVVYTGQRRLDRAVADYDQAIRLKPDYAQAYADRGVAFYLRGDNEKAVRDYDEAIRLDPDRPRTFTNRAAAYKKLGQMDKALADDDEAIRRDPKVPEYFDNRGLTYAALGDYDKAIADYDQAIRLQPRPNFLTNRGDSHQFKNELGAALSDYDAALRLDPDFALTYNNRAVLFKKMGERAKALADYEAALRLDPGNENAAAGRRVMLAEIKKFGAQMPQPLNAPSERSGPSFDCATAAREVEKVICADPQLAVLDLAVAESYGRLLKSSRGRAAAELRSTQRDFVAARNATFGKPGYDLRLALQRRLDTLRDAAH
ncbi:tetratricopeptide repeat protein [Bradyrhizobium ontarionense]|uniref:Tetratricopeptide repeat protein n=1 Tax=Bradyrhizobium ontarionense TaxID=2898149 RepID=A0ABY3R7F4_9BRAD|nr:tetratricopeptide repeat protein [Bradyrhizobium sp. A19]UFZ03088.1 tetratricopeptide repeat protein [Bradyrhizobium sp. A19]